MDLTHPHSGQIIQVAPDHAGPYLTQGWQEITPPETDHKQSKRQPEPNKATPPPVDEATNQEGN